MNINAAKIRPGQLYTLLFISRIFGLLTFPNTDTAALSAGNGYFIALTYIPFALLLSLPVLLLRRNTGCAAVYSIEQTRPAASRLLFCGYACFFLLQSALCAVMLDRFSAVAMFQRGGHIFLFLVFFALALLTAFTGMETAARAAPPVLVFFLLTVGLLAAATLPYFDAGNLTGLRETDPGLLLRNGLFSALRTAEPAGLLFYASRKQKAGQAGLPLTLCAVGATVSVLFLLIAGVTGAFGETQLFQFYTLTTIAEFGTVERLDDLLCALWMFSAMLKTAFYLSLSVECLRRTGLTMTSKFAKTCLLAAVWGMYLLIIKAEAVQRFFDAGGNMLTVSVFLVLLPTVMFVGELKRKKKGGSADAPT